MFGKSTMHSFTRNFTFFFSFLSTVLAFAYALPLNGKEEQIFMKGDLLKYYVDSTGKKDIQNILSDSSIEFRPAEDFIQRIFIQNSSYTYWLKIHLRNNSGSSQHYILESFNYRIDSMVVYETSEGKLIDKEFQGVGFDFAQRAIKHKNLTHAFWLDPGAEKVLYLKFNNKYFTPIEIVVRKFEFFTSYAIAEYFFLGIFYGSILIIALLNILAGAFLKSRSHYYYFCYILFVAAFFLSQDGIGFQFVWPNFKEINDYAYMLSTYFMIVFLLLYTSSFLNMKTYQPFFHRLFYFFIAVRTVMLFITFYFFPEIRHILYIDIVPFLLAYYCAFHSFRSNYPLSGYFLIGFTILLTGFGLNFIRLLGLIESTLFTFYVVNFCFLFEMIIFYFALAERIRYYKQNSHNSKELKKILVDKERLISQFTYKTSHDLSGPIKSIVGLTNLALTTSDQNEQISYLSMIRNSAQRLDDILKTISVINITRAHEVLKVDQNIDFLVQEVLNHSKIEGEIKYLTLKTDGISLHTDTYLFYTLLTNLLIYEFHSIEYRSEKKVTLEIKAENGVIRIHCSNNGLPIPEEYHRKIFDIFFRISNNSGDLGTYMHIVKSCLDKLDGEIVILNSENSTIFELIIPV